MQPIRLTPLCDIPEIRPGDALAPLLHAAAQRAGKSLHDGILVVCQKIISKSEDCLRSLRQIAPSPRAQAIAADTNKDPRLIELILDETAHIVRQAQNVLICETHHGFVCANAGVDCSNVPGEEMALLLPKDPDASARRLRADLLALQNTASPTTTPSQKLGVLISDTFGRPWREGLVDVAIGCAGFAPIDDARGSVDREGRELRVTQLAVADQLAAAAGLLMQKAAGIPAVWIEGVPVRGDGNARSLQRAKEFDLFR